MFFESSPGLFSDKSPLVLSLLEVLLEDEERTQRECKYFRIKGAAILFLQLLSYFFDDFVWNAIIFKILAEGRIRKPQSVAVLSKDQLIELAISFLSLDSNLWHKLLMMHLLLLNHLLSYLLLLLSLSLHFFICLFYFVL